MSKVAWYTRWSAYLRLLWAFDVVGLDDAWDIYHGMVKKMLKTSRHFIMNTEGFIVMTFINSSKTIFENLG